MTEQWKAAELPAQLALKGFHKAFNATNKLSSNNYCRDVTVMCGSSENVINGGESLKKLLNK